MRSEKIGVCHLKIVGRITSNAEEQLANVTGRLKVNNGGVAIPFLMASAVMRWPFLFSPNQPTI